MQLNKPIIFKRKYVNQTKDTFHSKYSIQDQTKTISIECNLNIICRHITGTFYFT